MNKFKRIYTIGCFDYFHYGHEKLLKSMKKMCETLIVGVHNDTSLEQLKNLKPNEHQNELMRMANVKKYADIVYIIPDKDPSFFLKCVIRENDNKINACFIRGNDMIDFPGKDIIKDKISIIYFPYTKNISSTKIRQSLNFDNK